MLINLFNEHKTKLLKVNDELFFQVLSSRDDLQGISEILGIRFALENLLQLEVVDVIIFEKSEYEKICNLIRKRIN